MNPERNGGYKAYTDFWAWLEAGQEMGFAGQHVCATHDGFPQTEEEEELDEEGYDFCMPAIRLYPEGDAPEA
jgi:hypothetical protein